MLATLTVDIVVCNVMLPVVEHDLRGQDHSQHTAHSNNTRHHKEEPQAGQEARELELGTGGEGGQLLLLPAHLPKHSDQGGEEDGKVEHS